MAVKNCYRSLRIDLKSKICIQVCSSDKISIPQERIAVLQVGFTVMFFMPMSMLANITNQELGYAIWNKTFVGPAFHLLNECKFL